MSTQPSGSQFPTTQTIQAASLFFDSEGHVVCSCGKRAARLVSSTTANPGRVFWKCETRDCKFFKWDDQLPPRSNSATPTSSQANASVPPATPTASRMTTREPATPSSSQHHTRTASTPSPNKRSAAPEPSTQAERAKRLATIKNAMRQPDSTQLPITPSSPTPTKKFKPAMGASTSIGSPTQASPLPAPDFGVPIASPAGSSFTVHGNLSADDFFNSPTQTPARPAGEPEDMMTPPDTGRTQIIPLPDTDNSPLKGKGKATAHTSDSDDELWGAVDDTMDLDNTQSTVPVASQQPPAAGSSRTISAPSDAEIEDILDNLVRLPEYVRSLRAENARLKEELERERTRSNDFQRALKAALK